MGRGEGMGSMRWRALAVAAGIAALVSAPAVASAADAEPSDEDGATLVMQSGTVEPEAEPTALQRLGELTWARWMMAEDVATPTLSPTLPRGPWLELADLRSDTWTARPVAITTTASALGSMVTAGMPFLRVVKNGKLRQRHCLRAFFKSRGVSLVWRIEF